MLDGLHDGSAESTRPKHWCSWCGATLPGTPHFCDASCLYSAMKDAREGARFGELKYLYKLRATLGWRMPAGWYRETKRVPRHMVVHLKRGRKPRKRQLVPREARP